MLASGGADAVVRLWDLSDGLQTKGQRATGQRVKGRQAGELRGHEDWIREIAFSPDGKRLVTVGGDNCVKLWDWRQGKLVHSNSKHYKQVLCAAYHPDGSTFVTGSQDRYLRLWDAGTCKQIWATNLNDWIRCVTFSPNGQFLIAAGSERLLWRWDVSDPRVPRDVRQFAVHTDQTWDVAFAADSKSFVTASQNGRVKRWPTTAFRPATKHCQLAGAVTHTLDIADGNRKIYVATDDRIVCIERKDRRLEERELFSQGAEELELSPDGHTLAAIQNWQPLVLYDLMSGVRVKELGLPTGKSPCLCWHPNGQTLAVVGGEGSVELWNWREGSKITHQFFNEPDT
jgi:WD40 repeat protein